MRILVYFFDKFTINTILIIPHYVHEIMGKEVECFGKW